MQLSLFVFLDPVFDLFNGIIQISFYIKICSGTAQSGKDEKNDKEFFEFSAFACTLRHRHGLGLLLGFLLGIRSGRGFLSRQICFRFRSLHCCNKVGATGEAFCGLFAHGAKDGRLNRHRNTGDRQRRAFEYCFPQNRGIRIFKGKISGKHFIGHDCQCVLVCGGALRMSLPLLRRHIRTGSGCSVVLQTDPCHAGVDLGGEAEVQNFDRSLLIDHNISGLDIPVHNPLFVSIIQRKRNLFDDRQNDFRCQWPLFPFPAEPAAQVFSLATFHNEIVVAVFRIAFQVFGNGNILMDQFGNKLEVVTDIFHFICTVGEFRGQGFECDFDTRGFIKALVNDAHSALAEFSKDFVALHNQVACFKAPLCFPVTTPRHGLFQFPFKSEAAGLLPLRHYGLIFFCHVPVLWFHSVFFVILI